MKSVPVKNVSHWLVYVTVFAAVLAMVRNLTEASKVVFLTPMGTLAGVCFLLLTGVYFRILKRGLLADLWQLAIDLYRVATQGYLSHEGVLLLWGERKKRSQS